MEALEVRVADWTLIRLLFTRPTICQLCRQTEWSSLRPFRRPRHRHPAHPDNCPLCGDGSQQAGCPDVTPWRGERCQFLPLVAAGNPHSMLLSNYHLGSGTGNSRTLGQRPPMGLPDVWQSIWIRSRCCGYCGVCETRANTWMGASSRLRRNTS